MSTKHILINENYLNYSCYTTTSQKESSFQNKRNELDTDLPILLALLAFTADVQFPMLSFPFQCVTWNAVLQV
jgi:hypothetical protein